MRNMLAFVIFLLLGFAPAASADNEVRKLLSEELLVLTHIGENTERLLNEIRSLQMKELEQLALSREQTERAKELQIKTFDLLYAELNWETLKQGYIDLYAATFTEEELNAMVSFYGSPAGRNLVTKMPALVQKSTELIEMRMEEIIPQIRQMMLELVVGKNPQPLLR